MRSPLGIILLLSGCAGTAAPPAATETQPATAATPTAPATAETPTAPAPSPQTATGPVSSVPAPGQTVNSPSITAQVSGIQTGVGDPKAPALVFRVSFENKSGDTCEVRGFDVAWTRRAEDPRHICPPQITRVGPNGKAEAKCLVPYKSPMRNAMPAYAGRGEVVNIVSTCRPSTSPQRSPASPVLGRVTGMTSAPADKAAKTRVLVFNVSLENKSDKACAVTSYSLAWTGDRDAYRQVCKPGSIQVAANGTATAACSVSESAPMYLARPTYAGAGEVVDIVVTCQAP